MNKHYNYVVIGAGSGGIASINRASIYNKKCAIIEAKNIGGTCVNLGCVPKKIMWYAAQISDVFNKYSNDYGFFIKKKSFNWSVLIKNRDIYIKKINKHYKKIFYKNKIKIIKGFAKFFNSNTLIINNKKITSDHILISTGSKPKKINIPGSQYGINSDDFFKLKSLPKNIAIVGAGYIAIEIANLLNKLGVKVLLFIRNKKPLKKFDSSIVDVLVNTMINEGISLFTNSKPKEVIKNSDNTFTLILKNNKKFKIDKILWAIGRSPMTKNLNLNKIGIKTNKNGYIYVDKFQNTSISNIYALGDNTKSIALTPVAISSGRILSERLFNNNKNAYLNYKLIPTVIFSDPPIGSIGLTEKNAIIKYGKKLIKIYKSSFISMYTSITKNKQLSFFKLICYGKEEKIIGLHGIGYGMDEILQGFSVAIKMGAKKKDFNKTMPIHPTSSEEFITMK
ncbi:glutathione-disulfide reductase [Sodalis-like secondary symbiont of Drepanosiphum platanoidis]|uniref:glutathione-disulfide reductase n=1 Tax=Sodalis-like secondary symbiont of Drepanosiphum platanoidis TaxID=2994493 RepID=UPI0034647EFA